MLKPLFFGRSQLDYYSLLTLVFLAASSAFTPGPNNALVAASGVNFGYRRTLPHILGIALGFSVMIFIIGLFLGPLFQQSNVLREVLRWAGVLLLLYVAYKIATAGGLTDSSGGSMDQSQSQGHGRRDHRTVH